MGAPAAELARFEAMLLTQLAAAGLPVEGVLVNLGEREQALASISAALRALPVEERGRSFYVSKMIAAAGAGLFDAALNYLWNETVGELRRRITGYDLAYFFDIAVTSPERRKHLHTADDLKKIDDIDLLKAAHQIGLLSDIGHHQLDHIRHMRNYASAAHPNQVQITGLQLATWLETCVRQVITQPLDTITAETGRLLGNIKQARLDPNDARGAAAFFGNLPSDRADALAAGLFGLYVDPTQVPHVSDNVRTLWPGIWPHTTEDVRHGFGLRYGRFRASADTGRAHAARELIDLVAGTAYIPEADRAIEIDAALDALLAAHHGFNNFYMEPGSASVLEALIGERGDVPEAVDGKYVAVLVEVFLGNPYGTSRGAQPTYAALVKRLDSEQASKALRSFTDITISSNLGSNVGAQQWASLLGLLESKVTRPVDRELLAAIRAFSGRPDQLRADSQIKAIVARATA